MWALNVITRQDEPLSLAYMLPSGGAHTPIGVQLEEHSPALGASPAVALARNIRGLERHDEYCTVASMTFARRTHAFVGVPVEKQRAAIATVAPPVLALQRRGVVWQGEVVARCFMTTQCGRVDPGDQIGIPVRSALSVYLHYIARE
jgi:hypothetical protein